MKNRKVLLVICAIALLILACSCGPNSRPFDEIYTDQYKYADYGKFVVIMKYLGNEKEVSVPDELNGKPVTGIGEYAFAENGAITSIEIPDGITTIAICAFSGCSSLSDFHIPDGVTIISDGAFYGCTAINTIEIPDSVTSIGKKAFYECRSLKDVMIPAGVTRIGDDAFYRTPWLIGQKDEFVVVGDGVLIDFNGLSSAVEIPDGVKFIGSVFKNQTLMTSIIIPDGVTGIGDYAFYNCSSLSDIHIPTGVTSIGQGVFYNCSSLTSIDIPGSVKKMEENIFVDCSDQLVISGEKGSFAQQYAEEESIIFSVNN